MKNNSLLNKLYEDQIVNSWASVKLLHPNSINIITDASTVISRIGDVPNSEVANAIIYYYEQFKDYKPIVHHPVSIKVSNNSEAELISIAVALETMRLDLQSLPVYFTNLNLFTDSLYCINELKQLFSFISSGNQNRLDKAYMWNSIDTTNEIIAVIAYNLIWFNGTVNLYHLRAHTNNMNLMTKDFINTNGFTPDRDELIYLSSILSMVDSLSIKTNYNII